MKRIAWALLLAAVMSLGLLSGMGVTRPAAAAGPAIGTGPWVDGTGLIECLDPDTHPMFNTSSGRGHCFGN